MRFLESLSFQVKLLLILLIPLGGILGVGLVGIQEKRTLIEQMEQMNRLSGLVVEISNLVHELQKERGLTAGFLGSRGQNFKNELIRQRPHTDQAFQQVTRRIPAIDYADPDLHGDPSDLLNTPISQFQQLQPLRQRVDLFTTPGEEAFQFFTQLNQELLTAINRLSGLSATVEIATLTANYNTFLQGKERAGQERAVIIDTLTAGRFGPGMYRRFSALVSEQETLFAIFQTLAAPEERALFESINHHPSTRRMTHMREQIFQSGHASALYILLGQLYQHMALRGAYHSVKNLLIRGSLYGQDDATFDPEYQQLHYKTQFFNNYHAIRQIIEQIRALTPTELTTSQRQDVEIIWDNIAAYHRSVDVIIHLQRQGKHLHEIDMDADSGVKIDDRPADLAIRRLMESTRVGRFQLEPNDWFQTVSSRIDQLKELENRLAIRLKQRGMQMEQEAKGALLGYRLFTLTIILFSLIFGTTLLRQLRNKTDRILDLNRQISSGDLTARIAIPNNGSLDELDQIANSMNQMVTGLDQTTRLNQQTMRALADSEQRVRSMLDTAPDAILSLNATGRIESVNPAGEQLFGYYPGTLAGCSIEELVPDLLDELHHCEQQWQTPSVSTGYANHLTLEKDGICRDEGAFPLEISLSGYETGNTQRHYTLILKDITERRQVKAALDRAYSELEERVRERTKELERTNQQLFAEIDERVRAEQGLMLAAKVFETATEGILITDAAGRIIKCNQAFSTISGYTQEEVYGRNPSMLSSGRHDEAFYTQMWTGIHEHGAWSGEIWNRRKGGEIYPQRLSITSVWNNANALTHYVGIFSDITEIKETEKRLEQMAYFDALTQLPNRVLFRDRLQHELDKKSRNDLKLAVMFIDLDRFKHVNDSLGHSAGDQLLVEVAERIRVCLRKYDTVARLGGDEFAAIITGLKDGRDAAPVARKIIDHLKTVFHLGGHEVFIGASIGISIFPVDGEEIETLTKHADIAMYKAKESGRGVFKFYEEAINAGVQNHLQLESAIRAALRNGEFTAHYQPKVSLENGRIIGMESLVRWIPPNGPMISPARFIPVAEETGLILPLGALMLRESCRQAALWRTRGHEIRMAVNLSAMQFQKSDLVDEVRAVLEVTGLPAEALELEITESMVMGNVEKSIERMVSLKELGLTLAVDDFGTGYSSLNYLKRFPIDTLKIDQSFVRDLDQTREGLAIVLAIISMGKALNLEIVAEGVETQQQMLLLKEKGCHELQGYYFSRPLAATGIDELFAQGRVLEEF
ncbi:MAG: EAL domain-containing protein [Magnetococcales bacterium]|nr:EAL domain-containing protein [Magnetococcales bacterium]NGZ05101.1 EAL domain-containing protein [Magnetococcales bacterium]